MCIFCNILSNELKSYKIFKSKDFIAILDIFPIELGHCLLITRKHYKNFNNVPAKIINKSPSIIQKIIQKIKIKLNADGFNVVTNINKIAKQEIFHFHWHIIPKYINSKKNSTNKRLKLTISEIKKIQKKLI